MVERLPSKCAPSRYFAVAVGLGVAAVGSGTARAQTVPEYSVVFEWQAPLVCETSWSAVVARAALLSGVPIRASQAGGVPTSGDVPLVAATVAAAPTGFELSFEGRERGQTFTRQLHTEYCSEAAEAAALLLSMMAQPGGFEPKGTAEPGASELAPVTSGSNLPSEVPAVAPTPVPAPNAATSGQRSAKATPAATVVVPQAAATGADATVKDAPTEPAAATTHHWNFGAAVSASHWVLPTTAFGVVGGLTFASGSLRASLEGAWLPAVERRLLSEPSVVGRVSQWNVAARGWYWRPLPGLHGGWTATLAAEAGQLRGQAYGTDAWLSRSVLWLAASGGGGAFVNVTPSWGAVLLVEAVLPLTRVQFDLRNVGSLEPAASVAVRARLGIEAQF